MAEEVIYAIAEYYGATLTATEVAVIAFVVETAVVVAYTRDQQRRATNQARDDYNASLRDRYIMVRGNNEPRQIVLGRARVSGPMFYVGSYGAAREHLVFCVALAAHEVDAIETIYFDDMPITLDGSGNVLGVTLKESFTLSAAGGVFTILNTPFTGTVTARAVYGSTTVAMGVSVAGTSITVSGGTGATGVCEISYRPDPSPFNPLPTLSASQGITLDGSGNGSTTLAHPPIAGSVKVLDGSGVSGADLTSYAVVTGSLVTVTSSPLTSVGATVIYQCTDTTTRARVRQYTGAAGQAADAGMISALPGIWTSAHTASGIAYLVVELDYDATAFPGGIPNVSATVRGAKVYDPRTGVTAWSDNPALLMRHYATSPIGGRQASTAVNDTSVIAAANICDSSSTYVVNGQNYVRPLYKAGTVARSTTRPADVLNDLAQAMAGKWVFVDGQMRVKAGSFALPLQTLDDTWLVKDQQIHVQPKRARGDVINTATAVYSDENQDYRVVPIPRVAPAAYITEDGAELPFNYQLPAVQFTGQAQHVAGCLLRDARAAITVTLLCNMKAYPVEVFDVLYVTLSRFGWVNKTFEVQDVSWKLDGGIQLTLKETDATIWALGGSFSAFNPAQATTLTSPFKVANIAGLAVVSGATAMKTNSDGTVVQRMSASWTLTTDAGVLDTSGDIEVRYGLATDAEALWSSVMCPGTATQAFLPGVLFNRLYLVQVRGFNALSVGRWSAQVLHKVTGVDILLGTGQLASGAATVITQDVNDFARASASNGTNVLRTVNITPAFACTIQFSATMDASNVCADSASGIYWAVSAGGGSDVVLGADGSTTSYVSGTWPCTNSFSAAAGVALAFKLYSRKASGIPGPTLLGVSSMTIVEIRR